MHLLETNVAKPLWVAEFVPDCVCLIDRAESLEDRTDIKVREFQRNASDEDPPLIQILEERVFLVAKEILPADNFSAKQKVIQANNRTELVVRANREGPEPGIACLSLFP